MRPRRTNDLMRTTKLSPFSVPAPACSTSKLVVSTTAAFYLILRYSREGCYRILKTGRATTSRFSLLTSVNSFWSFPTCGNAWLMRSERKNIHFGDVQQSNVQRNSYFGNDNVVSRHDNVVLPIAFIGLHREVNKVLIQMFKLI